MPAAHVPPYARLFLDRFASGDAELTSVFGRHMHWGWWAHPWAGDGSSADFVAAAERMCHRIFDVAGLRDGLSVLDAGCGFGGTIACLDARFSQVSLLGLNIDPGQLERARAQVRPRPGNRIEFLEGDACAMPLPDGSFDAVLAVECVFHFPDRVRFFQEARRVLRPGGRLVISDFVPVLPFVPLVVAQSLLFGPSVRHLFGTMDLSYPMSRYRLLAHQTGFRPLVEDDVSLNTLPTYAVARRIFRSFGEKASPALAGLLTSEATTRMGLLRYMILSYEKR